MMGQKIYPPLKEDGQIDLDLARKYRKRTLKILFLIGVGFLVILNISLLITFVCTLSRVKRLENEVDELKDTLDHIRNRADNLIKEIEGFEDIYDESQETDMEMDAELLPGRPEEPSYYVEYDDNYDDNESNKTDTADDSIDKMINHFDNIRVPDFTKPDNDSSRKRRDIIAATNDGVVVNSESYAERRARNNARSNVHSRERISGKSVSSESYFAHSLSPRPYRTDTASTSRITSSYARKHVKHPTSSPAPVFTRRSRVMHTEDRSKAFRQVVRKSALKSGDTLNSNEDTTSGSEFTIVQDDYKPRRYRQRHLNLENLDEGHPRVGRIKLPAVQYSGDTTKYVVGQHANFEGNGRLRHPQRTFADWSTSNWVKSAGLDGHFKMDNGIVTIKESGIYFVYAQIYYVDEHDVNGFRVFKNEEAILQCTVTTHSTERIRKGNTCYTAGVEYLSEDDNISLSDVMNGRYSLFEPGKSFFGLIKIGDVKIK